MAERIASGIKRNRQNAKRRLRNKMAKSEIRTYLKKVLTAVKEGKESEAIELGRIYVSKLDKAVKRHILHKNTVSRNKSRVDRILSKIKKNMEQAAPQEEAKA